MLRVVGAEGTSEHAAALALRNLIATTWPTVVADAAHQVVLIANAKCHGQRTRDVDVLLLATFAPGLTFRRTLPYTGGARHNPPNRIEVRSLATAIEVKDLSPESVRFVGTRAEVRYREGWKDASEQNEQQVYAVRGYLSYHRIRSPYITQLLWLRNVPAESLPPRPHPFLGTPISWELVLNVIAQQSPPVERSGAWILEAEDSLAGPPMLPHISERFTKVIEPTRLDRLRMEKVTQRAADVTALSQGLGQRMTILRGRGGTGKTMRLVQVANRLWADQGSRTLILTYNRALVADVRRLLTILGIPDDITGGTIRIQTVHSFLYSVLSALGVAPGTGDAFLERYEELKDEALGFVRNGAMTRADLEELAKTGRDFFDWDYVFVDEGQDWPGNERDLLFWLYSPSRLMVADGVDQLVRGQTATDWREGLVREQLQVVPLRRSLRMKAGLARFVTCMACSLGLVVSEWEPNEELPGGHVIVLDGPYLQDRTLHDRLIDRNNGDGNRPVDMLFCIPPALVVSARGGEARSTPAAVFEQWGFRTWDGASERVRDGYPTEVDQLRIVQYESCRGLEGWVVVAFALDRFYELKRTEVSSDPDEADRHAARWLMIPLTRAMDTLVIQLDRGPSPVRRALEEAMAECGDYVEWITT